MTTSARTSRAWTETTSPSTRCWVTLDQALKQSPHRIAISFHKIIWVIPNDDPTTKDRRPYRWVRVPAPANQRDYHIEPELPAKLLNDNGWQPYGDALSELASL